jgi:hypothetical protein
VSGGRRLASRLDFLVLAILAVAVLTRFLRLDLMEFKFDEAEACRLALHVLGYSEPGVGRFFPTEGLTASVSLPNPPLFVYLIAIPLAIVRSPVAVAAAIAAANVVAVWLCVVAGTRIYSRFVGVGAAALYAVAPWSVVFSRKIWSQDLLPVVTGLFLLELHALVVERRRRAPATLVLLTAVATQLHFSALVLVPVVIGALVLTRDAVARRPLAIGLGGAVILYLPFLIGHGGDIVHDHARSALTPPDAIHRLANTIHLTAAVGSADQLEQLVGSSTHGAEPIGLALGAAAFAGLVLGWAGQRHGAAARLRALVVSWYVLPAATLTVIPVTAYIHYFIVLFPLPFLGVAAGLEALRSRVRSAPVVLVGVAVTYFALVDVGLFQRVRAHDGAPADYGVAYRWKNALVEKAARTARGGRVSFTASGFGSGSEYRLLAWLKDLDAQGPARRYEVVDTLAGEHPPAGARGVRAGPLVGVQLHRAQSAPR